MQGQCAAVGFGGGADAFVKDGEFAALDKVTAHKSDKTVTAKLCARGIDLVFVAVVKGVVFGYYSH